MKSNDASFARARNDEPRPQTMFLREESRGVDGVARKVRRRYMSSTVNLVGHCGPTKATVKLNSVTRDFRSLAWQYKRGRVRVQSAHEYLQGAIAREIKQ